MVSSIEILLRQQVLDMAYFRHHYYYDHLLFIMKIYKTGEICCMMTSSNGNIFRVTDPLCGEFTGPDEFPAQRPVTRSFDVFFDLRLNKRLSKQPWGWWFETPVWSLWRHRNGYAWQESVIIKCKTGLKWWPCWDTTPSNHYQGPGSI